MANVLDVIGNPIVTDAGVNALQAAAVDNAITWKTGILPPKLKLYSNDPSLSPQTILDDLVEAAYTGYAEELLDSLVASLDPGDVAAMQNDPVSFVAPNPLTVPGTVTGYYWVDDAETTLIAVERFPDPFAMNGVGDTINITPRLRMPGQNPS